MYDLSAFQCNLLYVDAGFDEAHELAIKDELDGYYEGDAHHGRLHPNHDKTQTRRGNAELRARCDWGTQYFGIVEA